MELFNGSGQEVMLSFCLPPLATLRWSLAHPGILKLDFDVNVSRNPFMARVSGVIRNSNGSVWLEFVGPTRPNPTKDGFEN